MTRILIVDDNEQNLYLLKVLLEGHDYQVAQAENGAEALKLARREPPGIIITDILMPVMDGFTLCREWMNDDDLKGIPFVYYTATYTDPQDEEFALSLGADRFIIKPQEPVSFIAIIKEVLETYKAGKLTTHSQPQSEDEIYYKEYNQALIRKLEDKLVQLEESNLSLMESEEKLSSIIKQSVEGIAITDESGLIIEWNPRLEEITGINGDEVLGRPFWEVQYRMMPPEQQIPEALEQLKISITNLLDTGQAPFLGKQMVREYTHPDGNTCYIQGAVFSIETKRGFMLGSISRDVTENELAEQALKESEERFRVIFEQAAVGVAQIESKTNSFVRINQKYADIVGYSIEELEEITFAEITHSDDLQEDLDNMQLLLDGEIREFSMEKRYYHKNGSLVWVNLHVSPMWEVGEEPKYHIAVVEDITERKLVDEVLRKSQSQLQKAQEVGHLGSWEYDIQENKLTWSDEMYRIFGLNPQKAEITAERFIDLIHPDYHTYSADVAKKWDSNISVDFEYKAVLQNGETKWIWGQGETVFDENGNPVKRIGIAQDVTERKKAEQVLRENEEKYRRLFENSADGIVVLDENNNVLELNKRFCDMLGYPREELRKINMATLIHEEDMMSKDHAAAMEALLQGKTVSSQYRLRNKDGSYIPTELSTKMIGEGRFLNIVRDITERKLAEEFIRESETNLKSFLDNREDYIWSVDRNFDYVIFNRTYAKMYLDVYKHELKKGINSAKNLTPEEYAFWIPKFESCFAGENVVFEFSHTLYGSLRHFRTSLNPIYTGDEITGASAISTDISDLKKAEAALQDSEEKHRLLFESTNAGIAYYDTSGKVILINEIGAQNLGGKPEDFLGKRLTEFLDEEMAEFVMTRLKATIQSGEAFEYKDYLELSPGGMHLLSTFHPVRGSKSQVVGVQIISSDITERKQAEQALQKRARELDGINSMGRKVSQSLSLDRVISIALSEIKEVIQPDYAFFFIRENGLLNLKGLIPETAGSGFHETSEHRVGECLCGLAISEGKSLFSNDIRADARCSLEECKKAGIRSFAALPMHSGKEIIGVIGLASKSKREFHARRTFLEILVDRVAVGLHNATLFTSISEQHKQLRALTSRLSEVEESNRRQLANELHDEIGQMLTGLKLLIEMADQSSAEAADNKIQQAQALLTDLIDRVSQLTLNLRPPMLDDLGLLPTLLWHFDRYTTQMNIDVQFKHSGLEGQRFASQIETAAYRIIQEALTNVARHTEVEKATVQVKSTYDWLEVLVTDHGQGFDPSRALAADNSVGLAGIRERTNVLGGEAIFDSSPGKGTRLKIRLPLGI